MLLLFQAPGDPKRRVPATLCGRTPRPAIWDSCPRQPTESQARFRAHSPGCLWRNGPEPAHGRVAVLAVRCCHCDSKHTHKLCLRARPGERRAPAPRGLAGTRGHRGGTPPAPASAVLPTPPCQLPRGTGFPGSNFGKRLPRETPGSLILNPVSVPQTP